MEVDVTPISSDGLAGVGQVVLSAEVEAAEPTAAVASVLTYWKQRIVFDTTCTPEVGFLSVHRREPTFQQIERHTDTGELLVVLDGAVDVPCAAPTPGRNAPLPQDVRVYRVPAGSAVYFPKGGWHWAPFPVDRDVVRIVVVFKNNTSQDDLEVVDLGETVTFRS